MVTEQNSVSASFDLRYHWATINWPQCQKNVQRLQARIVQATKRKRWNKVKALQHLLTRSFSAKSLAVKRVTENKGKWTPGVDGQIWQTSTQKSQAIVSLRQRGYRPQPLRRVHILKSNGKKRPLGIPTIKDRAMQALYLMGLEPVGETTADKHSYGFRAYRSGADAISQIFKTLCGWGRRPEWILEGDIKSCFDAISHQWLMDAIPIERNILKKWLKAGVMEKQKLYVTKTGTPQGGIISPVLANMALDGMESVLDQQFGKKGTKKRKHSGVHLIRYADDFVITGKTKEILEEQVRAVIETFLSQRGLTLSAEKTTITHIEQGFDFLGQNIRKYNSKLIIKPSAKSIYRLLKRVKDVIGKNQAATQETVIKLLNPQIRGWAYYHRHVCARKSYEKIDNQIFSSLWRWAKRRHSTKGLQWIKARYFKTKQGQTWCFGTTIRKNGEAQWLELFKASDVPILRHRKIRAEANPFDKAWYPYFKQYQEGKQKLKKSLQEENIGLT